MSAHFSAPVKFAPRAIAIIQRIGKIQIIKAMKKSRKKVPYTKPSKRNPMVDIDTDAARRAKLLSAEKEAAAKLRAALDDPKNNKGKPVAGHVVMAIAASHLISSAGQSVTDDFGFAVDAFLSKFKYQPASMVSISSLWRTFLDLVQAADAHFAREIAYGYNSAFRWYVAGFLHRIKSEYDRLPNAIVTVEIWDIKGQFKHIAVQRDGVRRLLPPDKFPEPPMLLQAGTEVHEFIAVNDLKLMSKIGFKRFFAEIKSGKRKLTPRSLKLLHEDTLINVACPPDSDLVEIRRYLTSWFSLVNKRCARTAV